MESPAVSTKPVIVLLGNYAPDREESMRRFRDLMQKQLKADGYKVELIEPEARFGALGMSGKMGEWLGWIDKFIVFPAGLLGQSSHIREKYLGRKIVVHICAQNNAMYGTLMRRWFPVVVTCHDMLAISGALGEDPEYSRTALDTWVQKKALSGLKDAAYIVSDSQFSQRELLRIAGKQIAPHSEVVPLAPNYLHVPMTREDAMAVIKDLEYRGYILHVGSAQKRKNRSALLLAAAKIKDTWPGKIVFAGEPLTDAERAQAQSLGLADRVKEIVRPDDATLNALYAAAHALVFVSRAEGFGWPIIEAQAADCPVICSDRTSVPEIVGEGALTHAPDAYDAIAADIQRLQDATFRARVVAQGRQNAQKYTIERMMRGYEDVYRRV
jgi:glycosyltransferase involved in cell wall biosynthesis